MQLAAQLVALDAFGATRGNRMKLLFIDQNTPAVNLVRDDLHGGEATSSGLCNVMLMPLWSP